jgi:DNA modification methylase
MTVRILTGDCTARLRDLEPQSVQCVVTSPPYFGLRDYGQDGQIGLEETPVAYIDKLVSVFREVRRVLRDDGTVWLNIGDSYAANRGYQVSDSKHKSHEFGRGNAGKVAPGYKPKDLYMIPARVALALQADGWYLRSDIIWSKPNPMPESVTDRPTSAHEHVFLLTKSARYFYDSEAVKEPAKEWPGHTSKKQGEFGGKGATPGTGHSAFRAITDTRNLRNVWEISSQPYPGAHFAVFPPALPERCIRAGSREGDTILDPFGGAGTTGLVADRLKRDALLIELSPDYAEQARGRIAAEAGMFASVEVA